MVTGLSEPPIHHNVQWYSVIFIHNSHQEKKFAFYIILGGGAVSAVIFYSKFIRHYNCRLFIYNYVYSIASQICEIIQCWINMDLYRWPYQFYNKIELSRKCEVLFILPPYKQSTSFHTFFFQPPKNIFNFGLTNVH